MSTTENPKEGCEIEINAVLERVARLIDARNDAALAEALGTSRQVLSGWRKRGTIPYEKLVEFAQGFKDVSLNYLLWGENPLMVEMPVKGNRISAQKLEVIGDALLDAVEKVKAKHGLAYEDFMKGPQIFAYAAIVYNRTIDNFPPGEIWIPEVDQEIENIVEVVKLDFERQAGLSIHRSHHPHKQVIDSSSQPAETQERLDREKEGSRGVSQNIRGEGHQIAGGDIENNGGVTIGGRHKK